MRAWSIPLIVAASLVLPVSARAQQPPPTETAEALFNRAQEHAKKGEYRAACPLFAESLRIDPQVGTLLNLAACKERIGALAQAFAHWREAIDKLSSPGGDPKFLAFAKKRADELDPRVPRLTIRLAPSAPSGTRVLRSGEELAAAALGVPMPVNPGAIEIVVLAPGRQEQRATATVAEGERKDITAEPGAEVAPPAVASPVLVPPPPVAAPPPEPEPSFWRRHRVSLGLLGGAAAVAGAGGALGAVTGLDYAHLNKTCVGGCPDADLARLHREQAATNGLFIAAGMVAAASVVVFVVEARPSARTVAVSAEGAGAKVSVRF